MIDTAGESNSLSTFVVTGGAGFIGSRIAGHLAQIGHDVRILDNLSSRGADRRARSLLSYPEISLVTADIRDERVCRRICRGADYVLHLAADPSVARSIEMPGASVQVNVEGTANMLDAAVKSGSVRRLVFSSTCAIYGDSVSGAIRESATPDPISPYAASKLACESFCHTFSRLHGLETVALRYFNVYGTGQDPHGAYAAAIPRFMERIAKGQALIIYGDGKQSRDFVHVDDVVAANILAATTPRDVNRRVLNIGSGDRVSLNELIRTLEGVAGRPLDIVHEPERRGDIRHSHADISLARTLLGFQPAVSLKDGLAEALVAYCGETRAYAMVS